MKKMPDVPMTPDVPTPSFAIFYVTNVYGLKRVGSRMARQGSGAGIMHKAGIMHTGQSGYYGTGEDGVSHSWN